MTALPSSVLVIDDNELTRSLLMLILRGGKYNVVGGAENVATGLAMAKSLRPDVVLLDNHMPDGDGVDCIKAIRKELPNATILMVTANSSQEIIDKAMMMGANGFVIKPFNTQSVLGTIGNANKQFLLVNPATPSY
jgi:two-component system, chemotaxis family, chemotaxis protein CheY